MSHQPAWCCLACGRILGQVAHEGNATAIEISRAVERIVYGRGALAVQCPSCDTVRVWTEGQIGQTTSA